MKLGAALLLIGALLVPALAIAQPDLRMMAGIPRPDGTLADGTITVRVVRESLANNVTGHPVELRAGDQVLTAKTDGNGRATFRAPAAGTIVRAATVVDGERLESQEFPSPARGGVAVMLVAGLGVAAPQQAAQSGSVSLGPQSRFVVDLVDDNVQVYYLLEIINPASYPVNPPKPVIFDLPSGAGGAGSLNDDSPQVVVRTDRVIVTAPFAPGTTAMQIGFTMRYSGGELTISQKLPVTLAAANVVMRKLGEMDLVSAQFNNQQERMIQGERYVMAEGPPIPADGTLTFNLTGLPHHSRMPLTVTALLTGIIVLVGMWAAVSTPPDRGAAEARRRQLESRREKAFGELMKLEEQRRTGRMDPARHQSRRATLVAQLERIYGELDHQGPAGGDEGLAA